MCVDNLSLDKTSVWRNKTIKIPYENEGFCTFMGLTDLADSQNLNLDETSVWRSKTIHSNILLSHSTLLYVCVLYYDVQGQLTYVYLTIRKRMCVADGLLSLWMCEIDSNLIFCVCLCVLGGGCF